MRKMSFLIGFGAGYVLGAKAGTERYEQLRRLYENLVASPAFQRATGRAREAATSGLGSAREVASEGASKVATAVRDRRQADGPQANLSVAPPPTS